MVAFFGPGHRAAGLIEAAYRDPPSGNRIKPARRFRTQKKMLSRSCEGSTPGSPNMAQEEHTIFTFTPLG